MVNIQLASEDWVGSQLTGTTVESFWESSPPITEKLIKYGRLYNWYAANDVRGIAPVGWHVPSTEEWTTLTDFVGGASIAGGKLKEIGYIHWNIPNEGATNETRFTAFAGGYRHSIDNTFLQFGSYGIWWCSTVSTESRAWYRIMFSAANYINPGNALVKTEGLSIRLIKDNSTNEGDVVIDGDTYHSITIGTQVWLQQNLARTKYENGDVIGSDFSGTVGAVTSYNNDESNVYGFVQVEDTTHIQPTLERTVHSSIIDGSGLPPISSSDTGFLGEIRFDSNYVYCCVDTNQWKRSELTTW